MSGAVFVCGLVRITSQVCRTCTDKDEIVTKRLVPKRSLTLFPSFGLQFRGSLPPRKAGASMLEGSDLCVLPRTLFGLGMGRRSQGAVQEIQEQIDHRYGYAKD